MLLRDFIDDSLYNPSYGFFSKSSHLPEIKYEEMGQEEDHIQYLNRLVHSHGHINYRNIHHLRYTLAELFKPWYGYAIAKYMVSEYKLNLYPHKDLIIYEVVGGNGQLMPHILDHIKRYEPSVYKRTQYNMIELSDRIVSPSFIKRNNLSKHDCINILNKDIFDWDTLVTEQCFFLGMEVINRFAHDVVRYDLNYFQPYQGLICIDEKRNYTEIFEPVGNDKVISQYLSLRKRARAKYNHPLTSRSILWHKIRHYFSSSDYTYPEFIPTKLFQFMTILDTYFPGHRLILTDYASLSNTIEGVNAPLVQTAYNGLMTPCSSYLLPPGWYDIMFPTNFELLREMYLLICRKSKAGNEKGVKTINYDDFLERYGDIEKSKTKKGAPIKLMHQPNVKVFLT
ncbi:S-adenosyl-L-methionine-dependent methyltransferase [Cokeromyces recurvatus]|uniref:S-adenosyl-L-methionine-dependent methyltransferase n=1 Tax=Cokeromyces recurvatus TaxID=90255 RepID=UPI00222012D2|nr:S-adenosyl-L-methionine-dependent methyltransferase [Cokeromyces recurvatus]KAI7905483.1 S-adenosyl-L-methionine-dependent methyltransferase [Cokeromyces recurvatus]